MCLVISMFGSLVIMFLKLLFGWLGCSGDCFLVELWWMNIMGFWDVC